MFNKKKQIIKDQERKIQDLKQKISGIEVFREKNSKLSKENYEISTQNDKLKKDLREQTEADLFLTSAKICMKILQGEKKVDLTNDLRIQELERARLNHIAGRQNLYPYGYGSMLSSLGAMFQRPF